MATGGHPPGSPHDPPGSLLHSHVIVLNDYDVVVAELDLCAHEQPDGVGLYQRECRPRPRWFLW